MNKNALKTFARNARRKLLEQVKSKLHYVLTTDSAELRNKADQIKELKKQIAASSEAEVVERVAYTWFNRLMALRFMDANDYTAVKVVSPPEGFTLPEILSEAKKGHIEEDLRVDRQKINDLLDGKIPARDPQNEVYQLLLTAACNRLHRTMPFMFEAINDYSELLMPEDLLSETSLRAEMLKHLPAEDCRNVEIIGWLYQFYISEEKDRVINAKNRYTAREIPFATQLFTPKWIVQYMVDNTLGQLWLEARPNSPLRERLEFYIEPTDKDKIPPRIISSPEDLKLLDPACGSGHILAYAFELLAAIYEEEGYPPSEIPALILQKNLYSIEIDERAASLAAFALTMKAQAYYRRFLNKPVQPNILCMENIRFSEAELSEYFKKVNPSLFSANLKEELLQYGEAKQTGSLIRPVVGSVKEVLTELNKADVSGNLFLYQTHEKVLKALEHTQYLQTEYDCVITNPPYINSGYMNSTLKDFVQNKYPNTKSDLFACFLVRCQEFTQTNGMIGFLSPYVWMFISSYEWLREFVIANMTINNLVQLEYNAFEPACVPVATLTLRNASIEQKGNFIKLSDFKGFAQQPVKTLEAIQNPNCGWFYQASAADFKKISGSPMAYWVTEKVKQIFIKSDTFDDYFAIRAGISTGKNEAFILCWHEVVFTSIRFNDNLNYLYTPHNKGGEFRKWSGNKEFVLKYNNSAVNLMKKNPGFRPDGEEYYFQPMISWSKITSSKSSFRFFPEGFTFDSAGLALFANDGKLPFAVLGFLNSKIAAELIKLLNPTLNLTPQILKKMPLLLPEKVSDNFFHRFVVLSSADWDSYETSWDFTELPLLQKQFHQKTLAATYTALRRHWQSMTEEMQRLEEENNRIFIEAYGLQEELTPEVPLEEITLTCNPHYRYGGGKSAEELEKLLRADTMRELLSYAVGCMFGRYSLDKPGLVLANQGETLEDYLKQIPQPRFLPDKDNIIPILEDEYFSDDLVGRFKEFLKASFGEEHFAENLRFIEQALGKDIRKYFVREFYNDHVKRYKKRPIYWLFSSPNRSFNALIYLHRYRPDTVSRLLNEYLREYITKLEARRAHLQTVSTSESVTGREKNQALKEIARIEKVLKELAEYERSILAPLAKQKIEIDLDDGVKVNYGKFGKALYPIAGL